MEISWAVRKKRSMRVPTTTRRRNSSTINNYNITTLNKDNFFKKLPTELTIDIMKRLQEKDLSRAMCVSKPWRNLILHSCIPTKPSLIMRYLTLLEYMGREDKDKITPNWLSILVGTIAPHPFCGIEHLFNWCSMVMCCKLKPKALIGSCNGLLLFFHKDGKYKSLRAEAYHYYVVNPKTKQCIAVLKPAPWTAPYSYAALAYDPSESRFFKIVRFQSHRRVQVFSSETGHWSGLTFKLPQNVTDSTWERKSVYAKGSVYRLCSSGFIIKLHVGLREIEEKQAVAIELPPTFRAPDEYCQRGISVKGCNVMVVMSSGEDLRIWELAENFVAGVGYSFKWILTHRIDSTFLKDFNNEGRLLGFHPYYGVTFYKHENIIYYYFCCFNTMGSRKIGYDAGLYSYLKVAGFPFLECSNTFSCCLDNERTRLFQWLPVPEDCSEVQCYV